MDRTIPDTDAGEAPVDGPAPWALTVVHHPDPAFLGHSVPLRAGRELVLGRSSPLLGPGVLEDGRLSRRHVLLRVSRRGVHVEDLGSTNGTQVNGEPIEALDTAAAALLGAGRILWRLHRRPAEPPPEPEPGIVGNSWALGRCVKAVRTAATREVTVLLQGETGTGKELLAKALHARSGRTGPLVSLNCGAVSDSVLQSELFGHARGAFSGAERARRGLVRSAHGGTLFLDEIGDASPALQVALLRLVESREVRPVGDDQTRTVDVRFVAATHVPLEQAVEQGTFRRDLYTRLARWVVRVPPLRERLEDLPQLWAHLTAPLDPRPPSKALMRALLMRTWTGNVRELAAVAERVVLETPADQALLPCPQWLDAPKAAAPAPAAKPRRARPDADGLRAGLARHDGVVSRFAAELGVGRNTLYRWLDAAGIDPSRERG